MSSYSFEEVSNIYATSDGTTIKVHSVPSPNLQTFNRNISQLFKAVGDGGSDDFWSPIISALKRFRFDVSAAPLSKDILKGKAESLSASLKTKIHYCRMVYSVELAVILRLLAEQAQQLADTTETNLLDYLANLLTTIEAKEIAVAICESRLIHQAEETIWRIPGLQKCVVIGTPSLRETKSYSSIYIIGAPKWFPEFVFSSPRSKELHIIKHKWISGNWKPELVLISPVKTRGSTNKLMEITDDTFDSIGENAEEWIPRINLKNILDNALEQSINLMSDDDDVVVAKLFLLENGWGVFLDANDNSAVDIIDLDEEIRKRVRRAPVRELQPGIFILLRTEGGADYIVPVADRIMGKFKEIARSDQKHWKILLREYVKNEGMSKTLDELRNLGSKRATHMNLVHWMSFRGIRTENYEDFLAIMKLIGLEKEAKSYWETMGKIRNAHTKAGFTIRSMLLDLVNKSDISELKHYGKMDFELAEQGAGSLSAFRVIDIVKDTVEVIHWRIGEPFRIETEEDTFADAWI